MAEEREGLSRGSSGSAGGEPVPEIAEVPSATEVAK
jgi:hypothetical protein